MADLALNPTLDDCQKLISELIIERGYDKESVAEVFTLLIEETGELAKAIRKYNGQKVHTDSQTHNVAEELADVLWLVMDLSNRLGVDLEKAFRAKEEKIKTRTIA